MDLYGDVSAELAGILTKRYSTSFSVASRLFPAHIQKHIYNVYALVRIADEIVDTYQGNDQGQLLHDLEHEVRQAGMRGYSPNPIVHAYAMTAQHCAIEDDLIAPFFTSMAMDIPKAEYASYTRPQYEEYIYGSAEVVGLMCLKVFCSESKNSSDDFERLAPGAQKLGAAYQKVNFLRDIAADHSELRRFYFPVSSYEDFDDVAKRNITAEIRQDFAAALPFVQELPKNIRPAVTMSYRYYEGLLVKLEQTPAQTIKQRRIRLPAHQKALLFATQVTRLAR